MSTPTESERSESKTRPRACVALYAVVNDQVDPVDRDEYLTRHIRYWRNSIRRVRCYSAARLRTWATRSMGSPSSPRPTKRGAKARGRGSGCGTDAERDGTQLDRPGWR